MLKTMRLLLPACALLVGALMLGAAPGWARGFVFDEATNQEMARRLGIPVYFALPDTARARLPKSIDSTESATWPIVTSRT